MCGASMRLIKMNGLGNSFAVFDARPEGGLSLSPEQAAAIADPERGVGCDQVIAMEPSEKGDVFMRIWNADGGEVGACGNATRCVGWLMLEETGKNDIRVETAAAMLDVRKNVAGVRVDMGKPALEWEDIPLAERMDTRRIDIKVGPIDDPVLFGPGAVNMGNPHCVFFVDDLQSADVERVGPMIENHPLFPERANVGFAHVLAPDHIRLKVWERGVGLTQACGTGACAAVVAAARTGRAQRLAKVTVDGGDLSIDWREEDDHVLMTGPVELEYDTTFKAPASVEA